MAVIRFPIDKGTATGIDPSFTEALQESEGVVYKPGDVAAYKIGGRVKLNAAPIAAFNIDGIQFADLSSGNPKLYVLVDTDLYSVNISTGIATLVSTSSSLKSISGLIDGCVVNQRIIFAGGSAIGNRDMFCNSSNVAYTNSLLTSVAACTTAVNGAGTLNATYQYWATEVSINLTPEVESATGISAAGVPLVSTITPANNTVRITRPTSLNGAVNWRIYRSIAGGSFPIGWKIAEVLFLTSTYDDTLTDALLVLNAPYDIVTINGVSESMNVDPHTGSTSGTALTSVAIFEDSLVGTNDDSLAYSETGRYGSFPISYRIRFPAKYSSTARCVRVLDRAAYVMFDYETFRVNYLPRGGDSAFDTGICQEFIANYGTASSRGACVFSGWGGRPVLFVVGASGPILINSDGVDNAVANIDWAQMIPIGSLSTISVFDNQEKKRVELQYQSSASSSSTWSSLHFYYDPTRIRHSEGPFPEMVWTGPHRIPGPAIMAVNPLATSGSRYQVYSGSKAGDGYIYLENSGTSDAANLIDGNGTVNFRLRTARKYVGGPMAQGMASRVHIHKRTAGTGTYDATITAHKEEDGTFAHSRSIKATTAGYSSQDLNTSIRGVDVRIVRDDTADMPGINDIAIETTDETHFIKTTRNS